MQIIYVLLTIPIIRYIITTFFYLDYNGPPYENGKCIKAKYLNQIHNLYVKYGVCDFINSYILIKNLKHGKEKKLKYQMIDTTFIQK